jgi:hypothetical protein
MEERNYLALVLREANTFLSENEAGVRSALSSEGWGADLDQLLEKQLQEVLIGVEHLEDIVKFSELKRPDPAFWRDAESWQGVLAGVAAAALAHDVRARVGDIIDGRMPRMNNVQTR